MKNIALIAFVLLLVSGCHQKPDPLSVLEEGQWIDLTWAFDEESVYWPTNIPFTHDTVFEGINQQGYYYSSFRFAAEEHGGTHFDAPVHFAQGGMTIDQVPVEKLTGEGILLDVRRQVAVDRDYQVAAEDLQEWEKEHGKIPDGAIVLINTGFWKLYPDKQAYTGTTLTGKEGVDNLSFPGLHPDASRWLAERRKIKAVGIDTPSIDYGKSTDFMTHRILFSHGLTAYENLARLDDLPPKDFWVMALPMKIRGGSGAPLRIVAVVP